MCGGGSYKAPTPSPVPAPPTYDKVETEEDIIARDKTRKRLKGAVNTRATLLSSQDNSGSGKTLLGQ
ncbi:MAG: hypothetical protein LBS93_05210 [Synergistaceae bacterium]|nr:hypothetical protein [Synergistaceae bacterium]